MLSTQHRCHRSSSAQTRGLLNFSTGFAFGLRYSRTLRFLRSRGTLGAGTNLRHTNGHCPKVKRLNHTRNERLKLGNRDDVKKVFIVNGEA